MTIIQAKSENDLTLGRQGENLARQVVFDLSAWETEYGPGTVELIHQRPGDTSPYPVAAVREGSTLVWTLTAADTAVASSYGSDGHCELRYYVGEVLVKSRTWLTKVIRAMSTPSETAPPEPEQGWVDQVVAVGAAAQASADGAKADADRAAALAAEVSKKAAQTAQDASDAAKAKEAAQTAQRLAEEAQRAAEAARTAAAAAEAAAETAATDAAGAKQGAETAQKAAQDAAAAAANILKSIQTLYQEMQTWAQGVIQDVNAAGSAAVQSVQSAGDTQVQRVTIEGATQTSKAKAQADAAAQSASGAAQSAKEAAESAAVYDTVVADVNQLKEDISQLNSAIENGGYLIASSDIVQGTYNQYGSIIPSTTRIRPKDLIPVENGGKLHFVPGTETAQYFYGKFDANKTFIQDTTAWSNTDANITWDGYICIVYRNSSNTAITPADYDATTVIMTKREAEKYEQNKGFASFVSAVNPMNPLLFDLMYFRKGSATSGMEYLTTYENSEFVNDKFSELNAAPASSGNSGYLAFRLNNNNQPDVLTEGEVFTLYLIAKTNKAMTFIPRLSTSTTWAPVFSVAISNTISLSPGYNCIEMVFSFDHTGTDGRQNYFYFVLEGNTVYSDLEAEFSLVRGDNFLGWIKEIAASSSEVYDTDLLFWGDSLTAGAGGVNYSYPKACSEELGLPRINAGVGGETANTIAARQGGNNIIIPAGAVNGTYALNDFADVFGYHVNPLRQGNGSGSGNKLVVNGYACNLEIAQSSSTSTDATYTISGYSGPALTVPTVARFAGSDFKGKVVVIFVGQNGATFTGLSGVDARIAIIDSMIAHVGHDRYVILGLSSGTNSTREADDNQMLAHYGNKFFPTRKLLVDYGLTINGLTATAQDETDIAAGTVPTQLRSDSVHMNDYGYIAIGKMLADKIRSLGYV